MKKHVLVQKTLFSIKAILLSMFFISCGTSVLAQTRADIELCNNFSRIGKENAELRDIGKSREQVISYNNLYISDVMNKSSVYQEYLIGQVEQIFSADYRKLAPPEIQKKLYDDCIDIFKRAEQNQQP